MKLLTTLSHFCEKARWGRDRAAVSCAEQGYAPALHHLVVMQGEHIPAAPAVR